MTTSADPVPAPAAAAFDDPTFPRLHGRPARGWVNDPNGVCKVDGTYHVFFQWNPTAPVHDAIHWGHVSSTDLRHWSEQPVALVPRSGRADAHGCWTGCVTDDGGTPTAIYSAVTADPTDAQVVLATSDRTLQAWQQGEPVAGIPDDPAISDVRDPFVFTHQGRRYAVQGAGRSTLDGVPQLLLWGCDDLASWQPLGPLLAGGDPVGDRTAAEVAPANIWECPNLVPVDGHWVLVVSLWRTVRDGVGELTGVRWFIGDLEPAGAGLRFLATASGVLDEGPAFYAPQVLADDDRTLLWGWSWELDRTPAQTDAVGWAGLLTFPRELSVVDARLVVRPAAELAGLRSGPLEPGPDGRLDASAFEVEADGPVGLALVGPDGVVTPVLEPGAVAGPARVLVDGSAVEAYGADGRTVTTRGYPTAGSHWRVLGSPSAVHRLGLPG